MAKTPINEWLDRKSHISFWWATVFGAGLLKPAPGTWGSAVALIAGYALITHGISLWLFLSLTAVYFIISTKAIDSIEKKSGIHDASEIVADEIVGQWIALIPCFFMASNWQTYLIAFLAFRLFDIWKPWPIGLLDEKTKGGFGVMIDDVVAGIFAAVIVYLSLITFP